MNNVSVIEHATNAEVDVTPGALPELVENWPFILEGLRRVKADLEGQSFWEPEHIREALVQSCKAAARGEEAGTELWLARTRNGRLVGFAVSQMTVDPFIHTKMCLFIWITYKDPTFKGDFIGATCDHMAMVAKVRGYRWLECMTANAAFVDHLERHGWHTTLTVLRKPVNAPQKELVN